MDLKRKTPISRSEHVRKTNSIRIPYILFKLTYKNSNRFQIVLHKRFNYSPFLYNRYNIVERVWFESISNNSNILYSSSVQWNTNCEIHYREVFFANEKKRKTSLLIAAVMKFLIKYVFAFETRRSKARLSVKQHFH